MTHMKNVARVFRNFWRYYFGDILIGFAVATALLILTFTVIKYVRSDDDYDFWLDTILHLQGQITELEKLIKNPENLNHNSEINIIESRVTQNEKKYEELMGTISQHPSSIITLAGLKTSNEYLRKDIDEIKEEMNSQYFWYMGLVVTISLGMFGMILKKG